MSSREPAYARECQLVVLNKRLRRCTHLDETDTGNGVGVRVQTRSAGTAKVAGNGLARVGAAVNV